MQFTSERYILSYMKPNICERVLALSFLTICEVLTIANGGFKMLHLETPILQIINKNFNLVESVTLKFAYEKTFE